MVHIILKSLTLFVSLAALLMHHRMEKICSVGKHREISRNTVSWLQSMAIKQNTTMAIELPQQKWHFFCNFLALTLHLSFPAFLIFHLSLTCIANKLQQTSLTHTISVSGSGFWSAHSTPTSAPRLVLAFLLLLLLLLFFSSSSCYSCSSCSSCLRWPRVVLLVNFPPATPASATPANLYTCTLRSLISHWLTYFALQALLYFALQLISSVFCCIMQRCCLRRRTKI